jgi:hypothetical protein
MLDIVYQNTKSAGRRVMAAQNFLCMTSIRKNHETGQNAGNTKPNPALTCAGKCGKMSRIAASESPRPDQYAVAGP